MLSISVQMPRSSTGWIQMKISQACSPSISHPFDFKEVSNLLTEVGNKTMTLVNTGHHVPNNPEENLVDH